MRDAIEDAIRHKRLIQLDYGGGTRILEPHVLGRKDGREGLLAYQVEGYSSSGGLPQWRRLHLGQASNIHTTDRAFPGRRPFPSGKHSEWDEIYAIVDEEE